MHQQRQQRFINQMPENSVAIFFSGQAKIRSRDTEFTFCPDKYFYYLTGFNEPDSLLILCAANSTTLSPAKHILFCREKDPQAEVWHGRRLGTRAALSDLGMDAAYPWQERRVELIKIFNGTTLLFWAQSHQAEQDDIVLSVLEELRDGERTGMQAPNSQQDWRPILDEMRLFKSSEEIKLLQKAIDISILGHLRAMKECHPGLMEYQLQAHIEHEFAINAGRTPSYASIVGGGNNACILHYTENNAALKTQELVLIDAGAEYQGYAGDITRTLPINGQFTPAQKLLYQLVLDVQLEAIKLMIPGNNIKQVQDHVIKQITQGLLKLEILQGELDTLIKEQAYKAYYMHGIGHWLGLDVHDVGSYGGINRDRPFTAGMVLTVEPGIYINNNAQVPDQFKGIGIRIEDNLTITAHGNTVLSSELPKTIDAIEALMAKTNN